MPDNLQSIEKNVNNSYILESNRKTENLVPYDFNHNFSLFQQNDYSNIIPCCHFP